MKTVFYASLAVVPWVTVTLMLRWLISMEGWPVGLVGTFSRIVTLPLLAGWIVTVGPGWHSLRPQGRGSWLLLMGLISILINLTWFNAVRWTTATNVGMLIRFDVVFVILIGSVLGLERVGVRKLALLPLMFAGLALLMEIHEFNWGGHIVGDTMTIFTALGFSVNAFIIRHIMTVLQEGPVALYNHAISMVGFVGLGLIRGDFGRTVEALSSTTAFVGIVALGAMVAISLPLYYIALRRMDVWKLRMFMLVTPFLAAIIEWPLWGMKMSPLQWLGGGLILAALAALIRMEWQAAATMRAIAPGTAPADHPRT